MPRLAITLLIMGFSLAPVCAQEKLIDTLRAADRHLLDEATDLLNSVEAKDTVDIDFETPGWKSLRVGALRVAGSRIRTMGVADHEFRIEIFNGKRKVAESLFSGASLSAQVVRLDPKTKLPQVVVYVHGGGSGGFITVFDAGRDGTQWRQYKASDGKCFCRIREIAVDLFRDGSFHIVHYAPPPVELPGWSSLPTAAHGAMSRLKLLTFRKGRFVDGAPPEKLRRVYLEELRDWYELMADGRAYMRADVDDDVYQRLALRYVELKADLGEIAQAWAALIGPMGFSRNRQFLQEARQALLEAKYVRDPSELPLPPP